LFQFPVCRVKALSTMAVALVFILASGCAREFTISPNPAADGAQRREQQLTVARQRLAEVERSPSALREELRAKLGQARAAVQAALKEGPQDAEALALLARIDSMLAQLGPRARPEHPTEAEAEATLDRLEGLVKGGGSRGEVEAVHNTLRRLARRLKAEKGGIGVLYEKRAEYLWTVYADGLGTVRDVCPGCPVLDVATLAEGLRHPRLLGAGDYSLDDLEEMQVQGYAPLLTGDFNRDGTMDVALIGRAEEKGKGRLFVLIASVREGGYRRLFLQPLLEWNKAALAAKERRLILSHIFGPSDDFWWLIWNGKTFDSRYAGDDMGPK